MVAEADIIGKRQLGKNKEKMTNIPIFVYKSDSKNNLKPNSIAAVKVQGEEKFKLYVTDLQGVPYDLYDSQVAPTISANIPVVLEASDSLGKYKNGDIIPAQGWTFEELMRDIAMAYVNPKFSSFSVFGQDAVVEVGTTLSGTRTFNWTLALNSGIVPTIDIFDVTAGSVLVNTINDGSQNQAINTIFLNSGGATQSWKATAKNQNGVDIDSTPITVTALFERYWGAVANFPANTTDGVANRIYANTLSKGFKTSGVNTFTLVTGTTRSKFIVLLPTTVFITNVVDTTNLNANLTQDYVLSSAVIQDAGGTNRNYNMYTLTLGTSYAVSANHVITTN